MHEIPSFGGCQLSIESHGAEGRDAQGPRCRHTRRRSANACPNAFGTQWTRAEHPLRFQATRAAGPSLRSRSWPPSEVFLLSQENADAATCGGPQARPGLARVPQSSPERNDRPPPPRSTRRLCRGIAAPLAEARPRGLPCRSHRFPRRQATFLRYGLSTASQADPIG